MRLSYTPRTDKESVSFEVYQKTSTGESTKLSSVWTSVGDETPAETSTPVVRCLNGEWQTVKISKLPKYIVDEMTGDSVEVSYYVVETDVSADTAVTYKLGSGNEGTAAAQATADGKTISIVNNDYSVDIDIIKIDETTRTHGSQIRLPSAEFQLFKYTVNQEGTSHKYIVYPNEEESKKTTSSVAGAQYGTLTFGSLPDGQYKISETKSPDGYILTQNTMCILI